MEKSFQIQLLGHNAWLLKVNNLRVLIDPFLTGNPVAATVAEKVEADYILVSHGHGDHLGDTLQIAKRTGAVVVAIAEIASYIASQGCKNTIAMNIGGTVSLPFGRLKMILAIHSSTLPDGASGGTSAGFLLKLANGKTLYFACDTALYSDMALLRKSSVDYAFLPIGDLFTMGPDDAIEAVKLIQPRFVVPCHYNTWNVIAQDPLAWQARVEAETDAKAIVLDSGEMIE